MRKRILLGNLGCTLSAPEGLVRRRSFVSKTALVTGASSGLGLEFSKIFAENGYDLVVVARNEGRLYQLKGDLEETYGITVWVCASDLSREGAALDVFDFCTEEGIAIDCLVNNAGFGDQGDFSNADWQRQRDMAQVNMVALMQMTKCFIKPMLERGGGKILNISSVAAFSAGPRMSVYYASKAFVRSFSEAVSEEVRGSGVTVTALCLGPAATGFEKAAGLEASRMFTFFRPASAMDVAPSGYRAMMRGVTLRYYGAPTKLMNIGSRLVPRIVARKFAKYVNG